MDESKCKMIDDKIIKDRAEVYSKKKISTHITKFGGEWLNGLIQEVNADFLIIEENKKGLVPVFFREIKNIETFTKEPVNDF